VKPKSSRRCPKCHHDDAVVPIIYGYPMPELEEIAERGEVELGGCLVGDIDPKFACRRCRISFKFTRPEMAMGKVGERGWIDEMEGPEQFQYSWAGGISQRQCIECVAEPRVASHPRKCASQGERPA